MARTIKAVKLMKADAEQCNLRLKRLLSGGSVGKTTRRRLTPKCTNCGKPVEKRPSGKWRTTCSDICSKARLRAPKVKAYQ